MSDGQNLTIMTNDKLLSQTISYLRFPLTVGVVFIHFNLAKNGIPLHGIKHGLEQPDWYFYIISFFSKVLPSIAVPLFFFISGFLFFYKMEFGKNTYKQKLHTRAKTLLVPFLLWNIITLFPKAARVLPGFSSLATNADQTEFHFSLVRLFNTFFCFNKYNGIIVMPTNELITEINNNVYPIDVPMWYVRDLIVMVLFAPAIYWMIKKTGKWFIVAVGVIWCFAMPVVLPYGGYPSQFTTALFFFSWGALFSIGNKSFVETMRKFSYAPLIYIPVAIADLLTKKTDYNVYIHHIMILLGIVSAIIIISYLIEQGKVKVNDTLANASFFVFALHTLIMMPIAKVIFAGLHLTGSTLTMLTLYFLVPSITIVLCLIIYKALKRYTPSICNLLTGGR